MLDLAVASALIGARHQGPDVTFMAVTTDSRQVRAGDLFVALRGERFDGHGFVAQALAAGAVAAMVGSGATVPASALDAPLLIVDDTRSALGRLAAQWRARFDLPVIGITGSSGKTTVKDMLAAILVAHAGEEAVLATAGNLNNDIGLPLMLLRLRPQHRYAVIEMGMNHLGEIAYLTGLTKPTLALVTNAGTAHLGEVGSREGIARAKGEIYQGLGADGVLLINADDAYADVWRAQSAGRRIVEFALDRQAQVSATCEMVESGTLLALRTPRSHYVVRLQVPGMHNVRNALAAAAAADVLDIQVRAVSDGLGSYQGAKGRLQRKRRRDGGVVLDDTYNANPDSVKAAIAVLAALPRPRVLVLGDMGELGAAAPALHTEVGVAARNAGIDRLLTLGELSASAALAFGSAAAHFHDIEALREALNHLLTPQTQVLVKGSRFMRMERVVEHLLDAGAAHAAEDH